MGIFCARLVARGAVSPTGVGSLMRNQPSLVNQRPFSEPLEPVPGVPVGPAYSLNT